jgi:hypothetical protein
MFYPGSTGSPGDIEPKFGHHLRKACCRAKWHLEIRQDGRYLQGDGSGNLMPTRLCGGRKRWTVDAVILALGVCLRGPGAAALTDIDRVATRGLLDGAMQARGRIYHQPGVQAADQKGGEGGQHQGKFHRCTAAIACREAWSLRSIHGYPNRIQLILLIEVMPQALITVTPGNSGA